MIRDRLLDLEYLCRYMGLFRMAMMQTTLIRVKWETFWNILQVAGADQDLEYLCRYM
jgi:hypothetical protein